MPDLDPQLAALGARLAQILTPEEVALLAMLEDRCTQHMNSAAAVLEVLNDAAARGQRKVPLVLFFEALTRGRPLNPLLRKPSP